MKNEFLRILPALLVTGVLPFLAMPAHAQVRLNEFLAANTLASPDIVDFEDYPDWIELKNTTASPVNLAGYYLSDDTAKPLKWAFPATASIPANGYLRVWADGHDAIPGQSFPRGYWPWKNFTVEAYHTNFSLSSDGESVVLAKAEGLATTELITAASPVPVPPATVAVWKYLANGSNQNTQWRARTFDDSTWPAGPAKLGYGDTQATVIPYGPSSSNKYITTYLRHSFQVPNPSQVANLSLKLLIDDGAVIYLNGVEVVRDNLPAGNITYQTLASAAISGSNETDFTTYSIPASELVAGDNVIAVEVHQAEPNSSDLGFDLSLSATTYTSTSTLDSVNYGTQLDDVSMGRNPAMETEWVSFAKPTPAAANSGDIIPDLRTAAVGLTVSPAGGFYSSSQNVSLTSASGQIRYTLDGSVPQPGSALYSTPISVSATTVLRARVFDSGKPPGPVETRTYFFGETPGTVPYVSVVADPATLFDNRIGIYYNTHEPLSSGSHGLHDVYKGKDAPGSLEFFAPGGASGFRVNGGYRIGGENNWGSNSQHALNFALRGKYGNDTLAYDLFPGTNIPVHTGLVLRDGGDNWEKDMMRDALWSFIAKGHLTADTSDYRPSVVFINGAYWGIHNIRPRWDDRWFLEHKRVEAADIDHLILGHIDSGSVTLGVDKGNTDDWLDLMSFLKTADLTDPANYAFVESRIDIDSFIDFVVSESYSISTSWNSNREFWRERKPGSKWHWFLPDMDRTFETSSLSTSVLNSMLSNEEVLVRLKTNATFKNRLVQRFAAHIASTFKPSRITSLIDSMAAEVSGEIARHAARWSSVGGTTVTAHANAIQDIKNFSNTRNGNVHAEIQARLGVSAPVNLTLALNSSVGGQVLISGVPVDAGVIRMFPNIPFDLTAKPAPGYAFTGWTGTTGGAATTVTLASATSITANFAATGETLIGGTLASNTTLSQTNSPYSLSEDLIVPPGVTLTIGPGVSINMPASRNIRVQGALQVQGTAALPVMISGRNSERWGGISFEDPDAASDIAHLTIRDATRGQNAVLYIAAISGHNATLVMDSVDIDDSELPIFARGGSTILRNSRLHTTLTGDCINVKGGYAEVRDSVFMGSTTVDTDAIDFDSVVNGIISNNRIYRFLGSNCDAIDIGEHCADLMIEGNVIYFSADKGISVGQGSTVTARRNLIVGCAIGVGVKDAGSYALIDQNTFADCAEGVAVYEKNFGKGGGAVAIENTIISKSAVTPLRVDARSTASVAYSLSDTTALPGSANLLADPRFTDSHVLNYQLTPTSPAMDAGNPGHALDPDLTRADIGALYQYSAADYPFTIGETVVIEEILANSGSTAPDWIELHNRTAAPKDVSGWFLSDSGADLLKYRIPANTIIPAGGYIAFYEDLNFGTTSIDPGRITPFAISDVGETLYLSSAANDQLTDYQSKESFGASIEGESLGNYYKPSTGTWNFVGLKSPTPGAPNSGPRVGPIVISEINYHPAGNSDSEYFELTNITAAPVTLYDSAKAAAWRITDGIDFDFPTATPLVMAPGERIILTRNLTQFNASFTPPPGTRVFEWTSGKLDNSGEQLQLARPAGLDGANVRQYARVDRVSYEPSSPWPTLANGSGPSLTKIADHEYGNDYANWTTATANPGSANTDSDFATWADSSGLPIDRRGANDDYDFDGLSNLVEFALGSSPTAFDSTPPFTLGFNNGSAVLNFDFRTDLPGTVVGLEQSTTLAAGSWTPVESAPIGISDGHQQRRAQVPVTGAPKTFFRMVVVDPAP